MGMRRMITRQGHTIMGMLNTTPIGHLNRESGLAPTEVLLEGRQLRYGSTSGPTRPADRSARSDLSVNFRERDHHTRPGEYAPGNRH